MVPAVPTPPTEDMLWDPPHLTNVLQSAHEAHPSFSNNLVLFLCFQKNLVFSKAVGQHLARYSKGYGSIVGQWLQELISSRTGSLTAKDEALAIASVLS